MISIIATYHHILEASQRSRVDVPYPQSEAPGSRQLLRVDAEIVNNNICHVMSCVDKDYVMVGCGVSMDGAMPQAGDHWIVYGVVNGGKVLDDGALAAIHQRKSGTSY